MAKVKAVVAKDAKELAKALGLSSASAKQWEGQIMLLDHLRKIVAKKGVTHADLARLAGTSRTRVTSILNGNLAQVSTDLLIRLIDALGYEVKMSVAKCK